MVSLRTVRQLYADVEKLADRQPNYFAPTSLMALFNANLAEARRRLGHHPILQVIPEAEGQVRLGELLVCLGQLRECIEDADSTDGH